MRCGLTLAIRASLLYYFNIERKLPGVVVVFGRVAGWLSIRVEQQVQIKGIRDGLLITLSDHPDAAIFDRLQEELRDKRAFLQGGKVAVDTGYRNMDKGQVTALQSLFERQGLTLWAVLATHPNTRETARDLGLATRLSGSPVDLEGNALQSVLPDEDEGAGRDERQVVYSSNALFLRETVRSGRSIFHEGDVVILGDVNAGAQVVAAGTVVVWGRLRGLVHAGALGDPAAVICALDLAPTQLRIADQIAVDPDRGKGRRVVMPEQAAIRDGQIVAEPWLQREPAERRNGRAKEK